MTASTQLGNRPVAKDRTAGGAQIPSRGTRPVRSAVLLWPIPAPPVPAPPAARRRQPASPAHQRVLAPAAREGVGEQTLYMPVLRLVAAVTVTMVVVCGLSWLGQAREPGLPAHTAVARVGAGETVWDVAARVASQSDQRAVVERIRQLNGLVGSAVSPDQQLQVPAGR